MHAAVHVLVAATVCEHPGVKQYMVDMTRSALAQQAQCTLCGYVQE